MKLLVPGQLFLRAMPDAESNGITGANPAFLGRTVVRLQLAFNADLEAARNITAGHAVAVRGDCRDIGPVNRNLKLLETNQT